MSAPDADFAAHDAAVIDIGSNSIRLVLYRVEGRSIWTTYNEKLLAGLGRDLARTGKLYPEGVTATLSALRRFRAVVDSTRPRDVIAVATAAVRETRDGRDFVDRVRRETGFEVRILSGEEEARYSALGVLAGIPQAEGVAGDLGGYSLELIRLKDGGLGKGATLPLGPFALRTASRFDPDVVMREATRRLDKAPSFTADTFYAVGGAWRNLALIHMQLSGYPLRIVHEYEMNALDAAEAARFIARQSRGSLERIPGLSKKRLDSLPYAAIVLSALSEKLRLKRIVICAWGLREGLLFESMSPHTRRQDPLGAGFATLGGRPDTAEPLGAALQAWLEPAMRSLPDVFAQGHDRRLAAAACRLADFGARLHPDHRADLVFQQVLRAPVAGMDHCDRAYLAAAAFARHTSAAELPEPETIDRILPPERLHRARILGAAIRLGCDISGRSPAMLAKSRLCVENGALVLETHVADSDLLLGDLTSRRAAALAALMGRPLEIRTV